MTRQLAIHDLAARLALALYRPGPSQKRTTEILRAALADILPEDVAELHGRALAAGDDEGARFCEHRIEYPFPLSESWKRWVESDGKLMTQGDFAAFLEDHIHELSSPIAQEEAEAKSRFKTTVGAPTTILDLSRELEVTVGARVKSKKRLDNGDQALVFESDTTATTSGGQAVEVPGMFIVNVPVFHAGEPVRVLARLRYRPAGENGVMWAYHLHRPDEIVTDAVVNAVAHGESCLGLPFYYGAPEK